MLIIQFCFWNVSYFFEKHILAVWSLHFTLVICISIQTNSRLPSNRRPPFENQNRRSLFDEKRWMWLISIISGILEYLGLKIGSIYSGNNYLVDYDILKIPMQKYILKIPWQIQSVQSLVLAGKLWFQWVWSIQSQKLNHKTEHQKWTSKTKPQNRTSKPNLKTEPQNRTSKTEPIIHAQPIGTF